jgi:Fe-S-cluster containining protein
MDDERIGDPRIDRNLVEFDGTHRRLIFHGDCTEMRDLCKAMCCRMDWFIDLSSEEYASGRYQTDVMCTLTGKECLDYSPHCINRRYRLAKYEDRVCVYLKENRCSIYAERPKTCRDFECQGGWRIHSSVFPPEEELKGKDSDFPFRETFIGELNDDLVFVPHPLLKVHTVFCRKPQRDIIFVKEMVGGCSKFSSREEFDYPQLDDAMVMRLIDLMNRKESLGSIYQKFCKYYPGLLTQKEFYEIIWVLNKHNIVLDSRNFEGMLGGMGNISGFQ